MPRIQLLTIYVGCYFFLKKHKYSNCHKLSKLTTWENTQNAKPISAAFVFKYFRMKKWIKCNFSSHSKHLKHETSSEEKKIHLLKNNNRSLLFHINIFVWTMLLFSLLLSFQAKKPKSLSQTAYQIKEILSNRLFLELCLEI